MSSPASTTTAPSSSTSSTRSSTTSPDEVTASPRAPRLPEDCPRYGSRPDRHDYDGVHYKLWWTGVGVRSAVYAPDGYSDDAVAAGLARALAEIDAFDFDEEDNRQRQLDEHHQRPPGDRPECREADLRVEQVDTAVDDEGTTGPGRMFGSCDDGRGLPTEREALAAAAADLRRRLDLPERG